MACPPSGAEAALVEVRTERRCAVVRLARDEKLNALSRRLEEELGAALASEAIAQSRAVVVAGGPRAFSAGADVSELVDRSPEAVLAYYRASGDVYEHVARLRQPTVAAIAGYCLGGGLELALATDIRVAEEGAVFGFPEVGLGIVPSSGGMLRLVRAVGPARAKELVLRGRRFDAAEARELGIVTELAPAGGALDRALAIADELAALPPLALAVASQALDLLPEASREAALLIERLAYATLAQSEDAARTQNAFLARHER